MTQLFCDLKTDQDKADFFLSGQGYITGIIAQSIQADVAQAYQRCAQHAPELQALAKGAEVVAYAVPGGATVERVMQRDGTRLWAARYESRCLSTSGQWDYEPLPSSRTDEWLAQHRFGSALGAIDATMKAQAAQLAQADPEAAA